MFSPLEQFDAIRLIPIYYYFDFSFFHILVPLLIIFILFKQYLAFIEYDSYLFIPTFFQRFFELLVVFIFNLIKQQIGVKGYIYMPFIFVLFLFILICNLLSLLPFGIALTSHLIMILWLSLSACLSIFVLGFVVHNLQFLKIFIPECPFILLPMLILIEIFSYIIRAFSLAIRLSANIMAGHTLVFIISTFIVNITRLKFWLFFVGFLALFFVLCLELGVAFLQAYVFSVLVCIYLSDALNTLSH